MRKLILTVALLLLFQTVFASSEWGYIGATGPGGWGKLYPGCLGKQQSPINIENPVPDSKNKLVFHYQPAKFKLVLNPHNLYAYPIVANADFLEFNGKQYQLQSFHFHLPGEHKINGKAYSMELHLVHQNSQGDTLVVGVFLQNGDSNTNLSEIYVKPFMNRKMFMETDLSKLIPASSGYYNYSGSLTVPPCTQGVNWVVMENPMPVSAGQLNFFKDHVIPANSRPLQPLNGRLVLETKN